MKRARKQVSGFSLIEVVISMGVLAVGLLGVTMLYSNSLLYIVSTRDQVTATGLAQEGVELVRNIADNGGPLLPGFGYRIDINPGGNIVMNSGQKTLRYSSASGLGVFRHTGGTATKFQRRITIVSDDLDGDGDNDDRIVTSFVSWDGSEPPTTTTNCSVKEKCVSVSMELISH
jgi:prepilin-type N-terminal cleavage/methylation domain-containing protein